jgi:hypothetical protein
MDLFQTDELYLEDCKMLLRKVPVGRIGVSINALPVILPVNFRVVGNSIIFRTVEGTKLAAATAGSVVAFEVDGYDDDGSAGWSVMVQGVATDVTDSPDIDLDLVPPTGAWGVGNDAKHIVKIDLGLVTGRRFFRKT